MQVFLEIVGFSLQTDGSGRPVLTKGKRPKLRTPNAALINVIRAKQHSLHSLLLVNGRKET